MSFLMAIHYKDEDNGKHHHLQVHANYHSEPRFELNKNGSIV